MNKFWTATCRGAHEIVMNPSDTDSLERDEKRQIHHYLLF